PASATARPSPPPGRDHPVAGRGAAGDLFAGALLVFGPLGHPLIAIRPFLSRSGPPHAPRSWPWPPVFSPTAPGGAPALPVVLRLRCRLGRPAGQQPRVRPLPPKAGLRAGKPAPNSWPYV